MVRAPVQRSKTGCVPVSTVEQVPHVAPVLGAGSGGRVPAITANANVSPNSQMAQRWGWVARPGKNPKNGFFTILGPVQAGVESPQCRTFRSARGIAKTIRKPSKRAGKSRAIAAALDYACHFSVYNPVCVPSPFGPSVFLRALGPICARADSRRSSCKIALALFAREDGESRGLVTHKSRVQGSLRRYRARGDGAGFGNRPRLPMHRALARASAADQ